MRFAPVHFWANPHCGAGGGFPVCPVHFGANPHRKNSLRRRVPGLPWCTLGQPHSADIGGAGGAEGGGGGEFLDCPGALLGKTTLQG